MVVGSAGLRVVVGRLRQAQKQLGRDINPVVWTRKEWADRLRRRDHFLFRVLANPRLMIVGTENDAEGLAE
jgi:hypothetical protein